MESIVMYPSPAIGHMISMVELAKLILKHKPSVFIHIIIFDLPYNDGSTATYIDKVSATISSIIFHHLPTVTLPPSITSSTRHHEELTFEVLRVNNPNLHQALLSISRSYTVSAFILDCFCTTALSVTAKLNIPSFGFFTSGAGALAVLLYLPTIHKTITKNLKDIDTIIHIPGVPPIPSKGMPKPVLERENKAYQFFMDTSMKLSKSAGIIVNTFEKLESRSIKAMNDGLCVLDGSSPPIYSIGPLTTADDPSGSNGVDDNHDRPDCLKWLDSQPPQSVVFLCFGSLGVFSEEQLKEIAIGLEKSGQRFIWVVRNPPSKNKMMAIPEQLDPDLDLILPEGFLDRTKERGLVLKSWAPQVKILNHDSVGGFVTHCGWNSVLEAVLAGVPMVAWPLYAEQKLNSIFMVEEMKIALPVKESENGLVSSTEVEKRIRELMESEEGKCLRKQTMAMKNEGKAALNEGGSSFLALSNLFKSCNLQREF
ncbi:UDP-glycosyltransferase 88A1-like [Mangifera indica]|uniref:UDP-glycosyltransferase 88A1-like n=1 Tax=Mangifera indica TaxID=29780 RepID=UPI001CFB3CF7|nr:UDP-glycosyltransferase 88A1-like [Mangifera indica]